MNVNQIEIALSQKISASSTNFDLLAASKALQLLKTNGVFVVSSYGGLPAAASNEGKIYFIEDIETVMWSNGTNWLRLLDKTDPFPPAQLWSWGRNTCGSLGDGTTVNKCSPVREFCSATNWSGVSIGAEHTSAIKNSGEIWSWGNNFLGRLGTGTSASSLSPVQERCSAADWCGVSTNNRSVNAIKKSGEIWSWGYGSKGSLGDGTGTSRCSPVREFCSATDWCQVSAGDGHAEAIKTSGQLWGWGCGDFGVLGNGTTTNICSPVREICSATDWCQVSSGVDHTLAIKSDGTLWGWGRGANGRLGDGPGTDSCSPIREFCSATDWCQVSAGIHSAAIKTSGQLWAWGGGFSGQIGDGFASSRFSPVREFCSATDWCQVSAGADHTTAIKTSGQLWVWGTNCCGKLGIGTVASRCSPVREFCSATDWCQVSAGCINTSAIKLI